MSSAKSILIVLLALVALGAGGFAWSWHQEIEELRMTADQAAQEKATLRKSAFAAQQRAKILENDLTALRNRPAPEESPVDAIIAAAAAPPPTSGDLTRDVMAMLNNPDILRAMAIRQKGELNDRYGTFFKKLHFSPAELSQLKDLLVEKQMVTMDVLLAALKRGINPLRNPEEFRQLTQGTQADIDDKIKTMLGEKGYAQFQNYQRTQGQRTVVSQLEQNLSYTDAPLTSVQSEQLVEVLTQTTPPRKLLGDIGSSAGSMITDETIARARGILAPAQLQSLREIQQQQQASLQTAKIMFQKRGARPAVPIVAPSAGAAPSGH